MGTGALCCALGLFCWASTICFTLLTPGNGIPGLAPGCGGGVHCGGAPLAAREGAGGSGLGRRPGPGEAIGGEGMVGDSRRWARSLSVTSGSTDFPNAGRGDFGEPLSRLLLSKATAWLLNLALRALTSKLSSCGNQQESESAECSHSVFSSRKLAEEQGIAPPRPHTQTNTPPTKPAPSPPPPCAIFATTHVAAPLPAARQRLSAGEKQCLCEQLLETFEKTLRLKLCSHPPNLFNKGVTQ